MVVLSGEAAALTKESTDLSSKTITPAGGEVESSKESGVMTGWLTSQVLLLAIFYRAIRAMRVGDNKKMYMGDTRASEKSA